MQQVKTVLLQLVNRYRETPGALTDSERWIASKIKLCHLCNNVWLARTRKDPDRCPRCHRHGWNRPLFTALLTSTLAGQPQTTPTTLRYPPNPPDQEPKALDAQPPAEQN